MAYQLTTKDLEDRFNVSWPSIVALVRTGRLRAIRVGRGYRFSLADVEEFEREAAVRPGIEDDDYDEPRGYCGEA